MGSIKEVGTQEFRFYCSEVGYNDDDDGDDYINWCLWNIYYSKFSNYSI